MSRASARVGLRQHRLVVGGVPAPDFPATVVPNTFRNYGTNPLTASAYLGPAGVWTQRNVWEKSTYVRVPGATSASSPDVMNLDTAVQDVAMQCKVTGAEEAWLVHRYLNDNNFLYLRLAGGALTLVQRKDGVESVLASLGAIPTSAPIYGAAPAVRVRYLADRSYLVFLNDVQVGSGTLPADAPAGTGAGSLAFCAAGNGVVCLQLGSTLAPPTSITNTTVGSPGSYGSAWNQDVDLVNAWSYYVGSPDMRLDLDLVNGRNDGKGSQDWSMFGVRCLSIPSGATYGLQAANTNAADYLVKNDPGQSVLAGLGRLDGPSHYTVRMVGSSLEVLTGPTGTAPATTAYASSTTTSVNLDAKPFAQVWPINLWQITNIAVTAL